jgi:tetratricopeptide (TPR) repeat protein
MEVSPPMKYCAFVSYNRADTAVAKWLSRRLEAYRVPGRLVGTVGAHGVIGRRLGTVFRDRDELAAADDLGGAVRAGLADSEVLIVICSPSASASRWVNAEIEAFRALGRSDRIFAFVVGGEPGVEPGPGNPFPPALLGRDASGHVVEPMAADARAAGDGRQRAFIKLVAGMLGVAFDVLARREAQRRLRMITTIAAGALAGMLGALGLATVAFVARNDAERRQAQAEDILGFMLGDLRAKLTTVGRLDVMRAVDDKATRYYAALDARDLSDRTLELQARLLTNIGQVRTEEGDQDAALRAFQEAHARSAALHARAPNDGQRLFDLAQAQYWIGWVALKQARYDEAGVWLRKYRDSAVRLAAMDPANFDWQKEVAYGEQNLALLDEKLGKYATAEQSSERQLALYRQWVADRPADTALRGDAAEAASWLGSLALRQGHLTQGRERFAEVVDALNRNIAAEPTNKQWQYEIIDAYLWLARAQMQLGQNAEARANFDRANAIARALTTLDPANNQWRLALGSSVWHQATLPRSVAEAKEHAGEAVRIFEAAEAIEPRNEPILRHLAQALDTAAALALEGNDTVRARQLLQRASTIAEPLWSKAPSEDLRMLLAQGILLMGDAAARSNDLDAARAAWTRARNLLREVDAANAMVPFSRLECLVRAQYRLGEVEQAGPYRRRLEDAGFVAQPPFSTLWPAATNIALIGADSNRAADH